MGYIAQSKRAEETARLAAALLHHADFQALCEVWVSELMDLYSAMPTLEGVTLSKVQGEALRLRRILDAFYGAPKTVERLMLMARQTMQQERDIEIQAQGRQSDQA